MTKIHKFDFLDQISLKNYFLSKTGQMISTIEFSIFENLWAPSFVLITQFWLFSPNLPKKIICSPKENIWTLPSDSAYSNQLRCQISS